MAPDSVVRNIPERLKDSFQAKARDANRLQCSVERIWRRIAAGVPFPVVAVAGIGAGSDPIGAPVDRSSDIRSVDLPVVVFLVTKKRI
jgi:hypothetical protein